MKRNISVVRVTVPLLLLGGIVGTAFAAATSSNEKTASKSSSNGSKSQQHVWNAAALKSLKRETLPLQSGKLNGGGKSSENLRTSSQTLFGYNGLQGQGGNFGGFGNGYNGLGGQFGFSPNYYGGGSGGRGGANGYNQYAQLGNAYNVLDQNQGSLFGGQGQSPYYQNNYFGGGAGGFGAYPYASTGQGGFGGVGGGQYPFGGPQSGFGFGGLNSGQGYYPGGQFQGQVGNRNFGFVNQGFGNPAFRNPQAQAGTASSTGSYNSIPSNVQVGTGLEVGSRGFGGGVGNAGGFPSASGQQYIVGNGIGQPAFIGAASPPTGFGVGGSPFGGMYPHNVGVPGGLYRQQSPYARYDYPRSLNGSPSVSGRQSSGATRLQSTGPNRFYQGAGPGGSYAPNSRERVYRFTTSNES